MFIHRGSGITALIALVLTTLVIGISVAASESVSGRSQVEEEFHNTLKDLGPVPTLSPLELDDAIIALMDTYDIPGAQACVILRDSIIWTGSYGYMDARQEIPVTDDHLFLQASITKTVLATALLQCVENGLVDLDARVDTYLPFIVDNPYFPSPTDSITCRMILAHVSSIDRNDYGANSWYWDMTYGEGDWHGDLGQYCFDYFDPTGPNYLATNYMNVAPGIQAQYSNWAFTLLALVVENVTGLGFEDYVQDSVFTPLNMPESSWFLDSLDTNNVAMPMEYLKKYPSGGGYPRSVATADLNGDSFDDVITANYLANKVGVLINKGDGTFHETDMYYVGVGPSSVACGDFNGDTYIDLAVANSNSDNVSILLNDGDGTFGLAFNYAAGDYPWSVFVSYLDTDANLDLAVANGASNTLSVLLGNGNGSFQAPIDYSTGGAPRSVFCADFDGVNGNDMAVANNGAGTISVLLNNGDGTFAPRVDYGAGTNPRVIYGADFDGDTDVDLVTANTGSNDASVFLNNGDGTFSSAVLYSVGDGPQSVYTFDCDNNGTADMAVAHENDDRLSLLMGNGDGTFQNAVNYRAGDGPYSVTGADFDRDGYEDLSIANLNSNKVAILFNKGDGTMNQFNAIGHVSDPLWPIGLLRTSASQLAHHLATIPTYGEYKGQRVLNSTTVEEIMINHFPSVYLDSTFRGLGWYSVTVGGKIVWGHTGGLPGCGTLMFVNPVTGNGAVLLCNLYYNDGMGEIFNLLMAFSEEFASCCVALTGNVDGDAGDICDIGDLTALIGYLFIPPFEAPACMSEANVDGEGTVDIGDLTAMIGYLFIPPFDPPAACQ